jgi:hypothetical protein
MKKKIFISSIFLSSTLIFSSCGNKDKDANENGSNANKDVKAFCECVEKPTKECEAEMEKLEGEFQKDPNLFKEFAKLAKESCPSAAKYIERMK